MKPKKQKAKPAGTEPPKALIELAEDPYLKSIAQLQVSVEEEIGMIKSDLLRGEQARNINTARRNQYRGIELALQHKRLALMSGALRARVRLVPLPVAAGE